MTECNKSDRLNTGTKGSSALITNAGIQGLNVLLSAFQTKAGTYFQRVDFSRKKPSLELNGLFINRDVKGMLEGKDVKALNVAFLFRDTFIDRASRVVQPAPMTGVHFMCMELVAR